MVPSPKPYTTTGMRYFCVCSVVLFAKTWSVIASESRFSYNTFDNYNPRRWHYVSTDDSTSNQCNGNLQSPIAIPTLKCTVFQDYTFDTIRECYLDDMEYSITDHNLDATTNQQCALKDPLQSDVLWVLNSFHLHLGWEHQLEKDVPNWNYHTAKQVELHLVHSKQSSDNYQSDDESKLGVAIRFEVQKDAGDHPIVAQLLSHWSSVQNDCTGAVSQSYSGMYESSVDDVYNLLSSTEPFYRYNGSLTTPPCRQGVTWFVTQQVRFISTVQFEAMTGLLVGYRNDECTLATVASDWNRTARPLQQRNGRTVDLVCSCVRRQERQLVALVVSLILVSVVVAGFVLWQSRRTMLAKYFSPSVKESLFSVEQTGSMQFQAYVSSRAHNVTSSTLHRYHPSGWVHAPCSLASARPVGSRLTVRRRSSPGAFEPTPAKSNTERLEKKGSCHTSSGDPSNDS
eukprot:scaffold1007_cov176-Amphora_coffeaeformis.AAC.35